MNFLKEPYDPTWVKRKEKDTDLESLYWEEICIQSNKTAISAQNIVPPLVLLLATIGLSFVWTPIILLNLLTVLIWVFVPPARPVQQLTKRYTLQSGRGYWTSRTAPYIEWNLFDNNELYKSAVVEWFDAVREGGRVDVRREDWSKYLREMANFSLSTASLSPDFEKLKILKELMK